MCQKSGESLDPVRVFPLPNDIPFDTSICPNRRNIKVIISIANRKIVVSIDPSPQLACTIFRKRWRNSHTTIHHLYSKPILEQVWVRFSLLIDNIVNRQYSIQNHIRFGQIKVTSLLKWNPMVKPKIDPSSILQLPHHVLLKIFPFSLL